MIRNKIAKVIHQKCLTFKLKTDFEPKIIGIIFAKQKVLRHKFIHFRVKVPNITKVILTGCLHCFSIQALRNNR